MNLPSLRSPVVSWALGAAGLLFAPTAAAEPLQLEGGFGPSVSGGIAFSDAPEPQSFQLPRSGDTAEQGGLSALVWSAGLAGELRVWRRLGIEAGAYYAMDRLQGDVRRGGESIEVRMGQDALHVPMQLKGLLPLEPLTPFLTLGVEYVLPTLPAVEVEPRSALAAAGTADPYWNLLVGAGAELSDDWGGWDIRIPIALQLAYQPGLGGALEDRVRILPSDALIYTTTPRYTLAVTVGLRSFF